MFFAQFPAILLALSSITGVVYSKPLEFSPETREELFIEPREELSLEPRQKGPFTGDNDKPSGIVQPFAGNEAYMATTSLNYEGTSTLYQVYSEGYTDKFQDGSQKPVNVVWINSELKRLTVLSAYNGLDKTEPRLHMSRILLEVWMLDGHKPADLKQILGYAVDNENFVTAAAECRTRMGLKAEDSFSLHKTETDQARKDCWATLQATIFTRAINGAVEAFKINKQIVRISVDHGHRWDHVYYDLIPL